MKVESFNVPLHRGTFEIFISRKDIKIKHITSVCFDDNSVKHYIFYTEKIISKIIKTILYKKDSSNHWYI